MKGLGFRLPVDADFLVGRHCLISPAQELQPLLMTVFLLAQTEDFPTGGIQRNLISSWKIWHTLTHGLRDGRAAGERAVPDPVHSAA